MYSGLFMSAVASGLSQAHEAANSPAGAGSTSGTPRGETTLIKADVERLFMITEALWAILKHHHGYSDEQLGEMIKKIDLQDGKLDGKVAKQSNPNCISCGRVLIGSHPKCLYCGADAVRNPFER